MESLPPINVDKRMQISNETFWNDPNYLDPRLLEEEFLELRKDLGPFYGIKELRNKYKIGNEQFDELIAPLVRKDVARRKNKK